MIKLFKIRVTAAVWGVAIVCLGSGYWLAQQPASDGKPEIGLYPESLQPSSKPQPEIAFPNPEAILTKTPLLDLNEKPDPHVHLTNFGGYGYFGQYPRNYFIVAVDAEGYAVDDWGYRMVGDFHTISKFILRQRPDFDASLMPMGHTWKKGETRILNPSYRPYDASNPVLSAIKSH